MDFKTCYGYGPSPFIEDTNLTGSIANYDWGVYNAISNGGDTVGIWRTLSHAEWDTVLNQRDNAASLRGMATVCGVAGLVLLPDAWILPKEATFTAGVDCDANTYTAEQWRKMEAAGAVFLPAAGIRVMWQSAGVVQIQAVGLETHYWSSTKFNEVDAYVLRIGCGYADMSHARPVDGYSVRLVR